MKMREGVEGVRNGGVSEVLRCVDPCAKIQSGLLPLSVLIKQHTHLLVRQIFTNTSMDPAAEQTPVWLLDGRTSLL